MYELLISWPSYQIGLPSSLYRQGNYWSEKISDLPKVAQVGSSGIEFWTQADWLKSVSSHLADKTNVEDVLHCITYNSADVEGA